MAFKLPVYEKCCCCIPVRTGSLIIGYVSIIASCFVLGTMTWSIFRVSEYVDSHKDRPTAEHTPEELKKTALGLYISFAYYLLVFQICLIINVVLVIGVHMNKPRYLRIYFKATLFLFALGLALVVVTSVFMGFLATIPVLKWCLTLLCCLVIVRSTYLKMEEEEKRPMGPMVEYELQPRHVGTEAPLMA